MKELAVCPDVCRGLYPARPVIRSSLGLLCGAQGPRDPSCPGLLSQERQLGAGPHGMPALQLAPQPALPQCSVLFIAR